jgi:hypothetical protein
MEMARSHGAFNIVHETTGILGAPAGQHAFDVPENGWPTEFWDSSRGHSWWLTHSLEMFFFLDKVQLGNGRISSRHLHL